MAGRTVRRVLFVSAAARLGGAERSLVELVRALDRSRVEPMAAVSPGEAAVALRALGIPVETVEMEPIERTLNPVRLAGYVSAIAKAGRRLAEIARASRADAIHSNGDVAHLYAAEAARRAGLPCVRHARDMLRLGPLGASLAERARAVIAVSEAVREHVVREGARPERVRTVLGGVDLSPYRDIPQGARSEARRVLGLDEGAFVAGSAGTFAPVKRHEDFIRAFAALCAEELEERRVTGPGRVTRTNARDNPLGAAAGSPGGVPEDATAVELAAPGPEAGAGPPLTALFSAAARAVVFGADIFGRNGRYAFEVRRLADELTGERIAFPGWREDLPRLLPALDCFVSASECESFGRAIVEAMAAGVAVVATEGGGKREVVANGVTGILVPPGDVRALADAMNDLRRNPERRERMGREGRRLAFERFSVERVAREVEAVYDALL